MKKKAIRASILGLLIICIAVVLWKTTDDKSMIGQKVADVRKAQKSDIVFDMNSLMVIRNSIGYSVYISDNESIAGEIMFDKAGALVSSSGIVPLKSKAYGSENPSTMNQMEQLYGSPQVDIGSGAHLPTYIFDNGVIVTYLMNGDNVIDCTARLIADM